MKKTLLIMVMALAVLLTQCRKPEVKFPSPVAPEGTTVSMTVTAGSGSKTDITTMGGITWSTGDKLYVGDGSKYIGYLTIVSGQNTPTGTFSGDVTLTGITEDDEKTFHFFYLGSVDYTGSLKKGESTTVDVDFSSQEIYAEDGKLKSASKHHVGYGTAKGTVSGGVVTGINVTLVSKVALARFSFKKNSTDYIDELTLSGTNIYKEMTVNFAGTFTGKTNGNITLTAGHGERYVMLVPTGDATEQTLTFDGGSESGTGAVPGLESNKFYGKTGAIAVSLTAQSYLPGEFTVSSGGVKVKFSKGNLQYLGQAEEGHKWRFAEHQWDIMGDGPLSGTSFQGNVNLGDAYTGKYNTGSGNAGGSETGADKAAARDLFGWGATGFQDERTKSTGYQTNFQPYSTSKAEAESGTDAYTYNRYGYGPDYEPNRYELTVVDKSDWGCLAIGGDPADTWRTLSGDEWTWLLGRPTAIPGIDCRESSTINETENARFAFVKVNGVCGMLVFPDVFAWPSEVSAVPTKFNAYDPSWNNVNYNTTYFEKLESAGVVFLPAAGRRAGSTLSFVGTQGQYWSSSRYNDSSNATRLLFNENNFMSESNTTRYGGISVRLVRE